MLRRALAPALLLAALAAPVHADPVPQAVTHGYVKVYVQHFRCAATSYRLTGSFLVGVRTWHGTLHTGTCIYGPGGGTSTDDTLVDVNDTSADGQLVGTCLTTFEASVIATPETPDPVGFVCRLSLNGSAPLPVAFEVKTHATSNPEHELYLEKVGSFYGA